jgi:aminoglycoside/choline kinase family phosphotransferase
MTPLIQQQLLTRTATRLPHLSGASFTPIEKGGSARKFYRVFTPGASAVLVHDLGEREENRHYAPLADFLIAHGVPVPGVLAVEDSLLWLEDLGERDLWFYRNEPWEIRRPLYESALRGVVALHRMERDPVLPVQPPFDEVLYRWEQGYFAEHCLGGIFGLPEKGWKSLLDSMAMQSMAVRLAALPRTFVHRDFQSQNILIRDGEAVFIDFQGMRPGLPQYDLASLLLDPYVTLVPDEREYLLEYYERIAPSGDRVVFERVFWQCATQRLMQALGAYGNLSLNHGKPHFRTHVAPALANLRETLTRLHPEDCLDELASELKNLKPE